MKHKQVPVIMVMKYTLLLAAGLVLADAELFRRLEPRSWTRPSGLCFNDLYEPEFETEKVSVDLYYESLCPGCIREYKELPDILDKIGDYIKLATFPYGNAETDPATNEVTCQHGPPECYGNMLHACAIDILKETKTYVKYNACTISNNADDAAADSCGRDLKIDSAPIKTCAKGKKGHDLLVWYGQQTVAHPYTPYALINGQPQDENDSLFQAICKAFKTPPANCQK